MSTSCRAEASTVSPVYSRTDDGPCDLMGIIPDGSCVFMILMIADLLIQICSNI